MKIAKDASSYDPNVIKLERVAIAAVLLAVALVVAMGSAVVVMNRRGDWVRRCETERTLALGGGEANASEAQEWCALHVPLFG